MNPKNNDKATRSLKAIMAGADESVACGNEEKQEIQNEVDDAPSASEEKDDESSEEEPEEITDEEVESARKQMEDEGEEQPELDEEVSEDGEVEEEPEEVEEEDEDAVEEVDSDADDDDDGEEPVEVEDESVEEDEDEEPIEEAEIITEDEVNAYKAEHSADGDDDDDEEPIEVEDESVEEVMDEDSSDDSEEDEEADEEATTSAVASLVKGGFSCHITPKGHIIVSGCDEANACECGSEECPECNGKEEKEEATTVLRPVDADEKVDAKEVACVLTAADSDKPFYSVLVKGMPVASIHLEDLPHCEEAQVRAYFLSNTYPEKLASAMQNQGIKSVLDIQHARPFVAAVNKTELAQAMKAEAKAEFDKQVAETVIAMKDKFNSAIKLAIAGMNKNFFTEPNDLKGAIYEAFASFGRNEDECTSMTESVIAEADSFFDTAIAKAQELMGVSDEAFKQISDMVATAGVATRKVGTFASALEKGNNPIVAGVMQVEEEPKKTTASTQSILKGKKLFGR